MWHVYVCVYVIVCASTLPQLTSRADSDWGSEPPADDMELTLTPSGTCVVWRCCVWVDGSDPSPCSIYLNEGGGVTEGPSVGIAEMTLALPRLIYRDRSFV